MQAQIAKNVPIPKPNPGGAKYPFKHMEIGESVFFRVTRSKEAKLRRAATIYNERTKHEKHFITRVVRENGIRGIRVWRTK